MSRDAGLSPLTLLLAEDDDFVRRALTRALGRTGAFTVIAAEDGRRALDALDEQEGIEALLTDLQMPGLDGVSLIAGVAERGLQIPIAVMTGHALGSSLRDRLKEYGIAASFTKPIDLGTFADELQRALSPSTVGNVTGITIFGFLQLLEVEEKTGLVVIRSGKREGRVYFERGAPAHALAGALEGPAAVYEFVSWASPRFELFYGRQPPKRTIVQPLQGLLMEAARQMDESGRAARGAEATPAERQHVAPAGRRVGKGSGVGDGADEPMLLEQTKVDAVLADAMAIEGALGVALVEGQTGMILGSTGGTPALDLDLLAAAAADLLRVKLEALAAAAGGDSIDDVMITTTTQYHLLRFAADRRIFVHIVLDRQRANLALGRRRLAALAQRIAV